jgi:hypothetical protein
MPNYIRVKQINPNELSGFFVDSISSESGLLLALAEQAALNALSSGTVLLTGNQTISGNKTFANNLNVSGDLTIAGTLRYNEIIDTTVTGNISGYTGIFNTIFANNIVYNTGNQTISGNKTFEDNVNISGDLTLNGGLYINDIEELDLNGAKIYADNLVYNTGDQIISGNKTFVNNFVVSGTGSSFPILQITGVNDVFINGNNSFGHYMLPVSLSAHRLFATNNFRNNLAQNIPISGLKLGNTISIYSEEVLANHPNPNLKVFQYLTVPGPIADSHNTINITGGIYSGYGLRKIKNGPTIANNYKVINSLESGGAQIIPKQRHPETVYNINVESGKGSIRSLTFGTPVMPVANNPIITLKFNFKADTGVCIVSGRYPNGDAIFTITGSNYDFIQTERLMYNHNGPGGGFYVRI